MKSPLAELKAFEFPAVMCEKSILEVDLETKATRTPNPVLEIRQVGLLCILQIRLRLLYY